MSTSESGGYRAVTDYLFGLKPRGAKLGIDRMRPLAAAIGNPERMLPTIHVAGTNGKGSVAAMLEAILRAAGWRVGLYTSPHLVHLGERVQVDRVPLGENEIVSYTREIDPVADRIAAEYGDESRPSFFEFMTAMALLHFTRQRCDVAVIETGLGGEFDATNVILPEVAVITSIGIDHCEWLGSSIEKIAEAKAGIIKPDTPVVIGRLPTEAERVIRERASQQRARVFAVREEFGDDWHAYPEARLEGVYQRWNAATATLAARTLGARWRVNEAAIRRGLETAAWPGRWERRRVEGRTLIFDAAHNAEGAETLALNLAQTARAGAARKPLAIVGVLGVDRAKPLLETLCAQVGAVHLVEPKDPRACKREELERLVPEHYDGAVVYDAVERIFPGGDRCLLGETGDTIVITGSIYLLGEVMARLRSGPAA